MYSFLCELWAWRLVDRHKGEQLVNWDYGEKRRVEN